MSPIKMLRRGLDPNLLILQRIFVPKQVGYEMVLHIMSVRIKTDRNFFD